MIFELYTLKVGIYRGTLLETNLKSPTNYFGYKYLYSFSIVDNLKL